MVSTAKQEASCARSRTWPRAWRTDRTTSRALVEEALARIADPGRRGRRTFIKVHAEQARAAADAVDAARRVGLPLGRYAGIPIALKDLFDIAGEPTPAGSKVLADAAAGTAERDRCATHAERRVHRDGPGQHDRVRVLRPRHQSALRHADLAVGSRCGAHPGRQFVRHRGRGGRRHGGGRTGHRYRRFVPDSGGVLWCRRLQADGAASADHRRAAAGAIAGLGRSAGAHGGLLRGDRRHPGGRAADPSGAGAACAAYAWRCRKTSCWMAWMRRWPRRSNTLCRCCRIAGAQRSRASGSRRSTRSARSMPKAAMRRARLTRGIARCWQPKGAGYDPRIRVRIMRGEGMSAADYLDLAPARGADHCGVRCQHAGFRLCRDANGADRCTADRRSGR